MHPEPADKIKSPCTERLIAIELTGDESFNVQPITVRIRNPIAPSSSDINASDVGWGEQIDPSEEAFNDGQTGAIVPVKVAEIDGFGEIWHCLEFSRLKLKMMEESVDFHFTAVVRMRVLLDLDHVAVGKNIVLLKRAMNPSGLADPVSP